MLRVFVLLLALSASSAFGQSRPGTLSNWSGVLSLGAPKWSSNLYRINNEALRSGDGFSDLSAGQLGVKLQLSYTFLPSYGRWAVTLGGGQDRAILENFAGRPHVQGVETAANVRRAALDRQHLDFGLQVTPWVTTYLRANLRAGLHTSTTRASQQLEDGRIADDFSFASQGTFQEFGFEIGPSTAFLYVSVYMTQQKTANLRAFNDQPADLHGYAYYVGLGRYSF
ncbi:MAG: hypothetical protein KF767_06705 [Bdellovibrionaceae bacterium]|nr:hypothetical protein [Pseudobdellovibrionaceae bacterium]